MCLKSSPGTFWHIMTSASHLGSASGESSSCVWILKNYIESCQLGLHPETTRNNMSVYVILRLHHIIVFKSGEVGILRTAVYRTESTRVVMLPIMSTWVKLLKLGFWEVIWIGYIWFEFLRLKYHLEQFATEPEKGLQSCWVGLFT